MKKIPQIIRLFMHCMILSTMIFSCQNEDLVEPQESENFLGKISQKSIALSVVNPNLVLEDYTDCASVCIEEGSETYYAVAGSDTGSAGPNSKLVSYKAYNTATQFVLNVSYTITSGSSGAQADITMNINGNVVSVEDVVSGSTVSHMIDLPADWQACDEIPFSILQEGLSNPIEFSGSYALIGICDDICDESFSYEDNLDGSYTFTYISAEDLDSAEIKFTSPHIVSFVALDGKTYTVNPGNGNGSPTVLTWTGTIEACTAITFTLDFEADCDQNNGGFANIFTDFKVNGVSKKGENPSIKFECPSE